MTSLENWPRIIADAAVEALEEANTRHGVPEIMNIDQDRQFTAAALIDATTEET